jgi:hypothetical protein
MSPAALTDSTYPEADSGPPKPDFVGPRCEATLRYQYIEPPESWGNLVETDFGISRTYPHIGICLLDDPLAKVDVGSFPRSHLPNPSMSGLVVRPTTADFYVLTFLGTLDTRKVNDKKLYGC